MECKVSESEEVRETMSEDVKKKRALYYSEKGDESADEDDKTEMENVNNYDRGRKREKKKPIKKSRWSHSESRSFSRTERRSDEDDLYIGVKMKINRSNISSDVESGSRSDEDLPYHGRTVGRESEYDILKEVVPLVEQIPGDVFVNDEFFPKYQKTDNSNSEDFEDDEILEEDIRINLTGRGYQKEISLSYGKLASNHICKEVLEQVLSSIFEDDPYDFNTEMENVKTTSYRPIRGVAPKLSFEEGKDYLKHEDEEDEDGEPSSLKEVFNEIFGTDDDSVNLREKLDEVFNDVFGKQDTETVDSSELLEEAFNDVFGKSKDEKDDEILVCCGQNCSDDCTNKDCYSFSDSIRLTREKIKGFSKSELHQFILSRLNIMRELGLEITTGIVLEQKTFCQKAVMTLFGISNYMLRTCIKEHLANKVFHVHGNLGNMYSSNNRDGAISFILSFAQMHSENLPDKTVLQLPHYLNIKELYSYYTENTPQEVRVKERSFYQIFKSYFGDVSRLDHGLPRITFNSANTHPVCVECDEIKTLKRSAKHESHLLYAQSRQRQHLSWVRRQYLQFTYRQELAKRFSADYLHIGRIEMLSDLKVFNALVPCLYYRGGIKLACNFILSDLRVLSQSSTNTQFLNLRRGNKLFNHCIHLFDILK